MLFLQHLTAIKQNKSKVRIIYKHHFVKKKSFRVKTFKWYVRVYRLFKGRQERKKNF